MKSVCKSNPIVGECACAYKIQSYFGVVHSVVNCGVNNRTADRLQQDKIETHYDKNERQNVFYVEELFQAIFY